MLKPVLDMIEQRKNDQYKNDAVVHDYPVIVSLANEVETITELGV